MLGGSIFFFMPRQRPRDLGVTEAPLLDRLRALPRWRALVKRKLCEPRAVATSFIAVASSLRWSSRGVFSIFARAFAWSIYARVLPIDSPECFRNEAGSFPQPEVSATTYQ